MGSAFYQMVKSLGVNTKAYTTPAVGSRIRYRLHGRNIIHEGTVIAVRDQELADGTPVIIVTDERDEGPVQGPIFIFQDELVD